MIKKIILALAFVATLSIPTLRAQEALFFDTGAPLTPFTLGVRVGVNSSNTTHSNNGLTSNLDSWGTGLDVGAVFDINLRDYLTLQPGIFFDIKNNRYCHSTTDYDKQLNTLNLTSNEGKTRHTTFTVPIIASVRFNFSDYVRWYVDCGPYFQFGLGGHDKGDFTQLNSAESLSTIYTGYNNGYYDLRNKFDWGLKIGTALRVYDHYYVGIHYEAGFRRAYKLKEFGGHNKAWLFSLGYDF